MTTAAEMLVIIDAAIIDVLQNGQEVKWSNGVTYTKANVTDLFAMREKYSGKADDESSSNAFFSRAKTIIPRRS